jgi:hypothetical protein
VHCECRFPDAFLHALPACLIRLLPFSELHLKQAA